MKKEIQRVFLTYEMLQDYDPEECVTALKIAALGGDPTLQMSTVAQAMYNNITGTLTPRSLCPEGRRVYEAVETLKGPLRNDPKTSEVRFFTSFCDAVIDTALYMRKDTTNALQRMVLSRSLVETLSFLIVHSKAHNKELTREEARECLRSLRSNTQTICTEKPESETFERAYTNVIYIKDYLDSKQGEPQ